MSWGARHIIFYLTAFMGWMPHYYYLRGVSRKIHQIYLLRGGKYARCVLNEYYGEQTNVWITLKELHLLNREQDKFDDTYEFLNSEGQLNHEVAVEVDYFNYFGVPHNNDTIFFMKEGKVHQPELFEQCLKGYNIDDTDFEINTEDNVRWMEPHKNY